MQSQRIRRVLTEQGLVVTASFLRFLGTSCPTLHETVELCNLLFELGLTKQGKEDLVAYLICRQGDV